MYICQNKIITKLYNPDSGCILCLLCEHSQNLLPQHPEPKPRSYFANTREIFFANKTEQCQSRAAVGAPGVRKEDRRGVRKEIDRGSIYIDIYIYIYIATCK